MSIIRSVMSCFESPDGAEYQARWGRKARGATGRDKVGHATRPGVRGGVRAALRIARRNIDMMIALRGEGAKIRLRDQFFFLKNIVP